RLIAGFFVLLLVLLGYLAVKNVELVRSNRGLTQNLSRLSEEQFAIKRGLDRIEAEKLIVAKLLKNGARESERLKNTIIEIEKKRVKEENTLNKELVDALVSERRNLEEQLNRLWQEKGELEKKLGSYTNTETGLKTRLAKLEDKKFILENKSLQFMYQWLVTAQNRQTGLVVSFDRDPAFADVGFTYDQALSAFSFIYFKEFDKAQQLFGFFKNKAEKVNRGFANAYDIETGKISEYIVHSGPSIYLGLAALKYEEATGDKKFQSLAKEIADWILLLQEEQKEGAIPGGPRLSWTSTEHNIAAYVFLDQLYKKTKELKYEKSKQKILSWLENFGYNAKLKRFNRGEKDLMIATDTIALGIIALGPERLEKMGVDIGGLIECAERNCKTKVQLVDNNGKNIFVTGFDFCCPSSIGRGGVISVEWTAQMVIAFRELSRYYARSGERSKARLYQRKASYYFAEMEKLLLVRSSFGRRGAKGGLPYSTASGVDTGHGWYTPSNNAISAAGTNFAIFAQQDYNMFKM
ncbi:MAG: hypothetical protein KKF93_07480, partial [Candidatus Omnitrophica bacterium]|nr:hypothetical protein [Candidatus Omnitrophota bacterium]